MDVAQSAICNLQSAIVLDGALVVQHDRIVAQPLAFAAGRVVAAAPGDALRLDLRDHLIFPGLINAHDHLQLNNIPPLPHAAPFPNSYAWIAAFAPHFQNPDVAVAIAVPSAERHWHGGLKNLLGGATTVAHHDPWQAVLDDPAFPVGLLRAFGWSHSLGLGLERPGSGAARGASFATPVDELPRYGPPVRASFMATPAWQPWLIHLAEGADALARAELSQLDALGCLAANTVLVHGAGLTAADVDRILECGAAVVWCPSSNLGMLGRTLDPRRLCAAGRLALGSDSRLTGARDMLDELRVAASHSDLTPRELLRLVTSDASAVLRLPDLGGLAPGQRADCVIVRQRSDDPYQDLIDITRGAIRIVVRGGVPQIADPDFAEWFAYSGINAVPVHLDGRPKLIARHLARPDCIALEAGFDI